MSTRVHAFVVALFLLLPLQAAAQGMVETGAEPTPNPLLPADTSSPRDTLRSYYDSINEALLAYWSDAPEEELNQARRRAIETFDFSQLPDRDRNTAESEKALLLKEILDRIELPPENEIPGDDDVAASDPPLTRWTLPGTRITVARIAEGPRTGEFLFTAGTVQRLDDYYERIRDLPYKDRSFVGAYESYKHRPGPMVPRSWANALPLWSNTVVLGESLWQWFAFAIVGLAAILLIRWLLKWGRRWDEQHQSDSALSRFGLPFGVLASIGILFVSRYAFLDMIRLRSLLGSMSSLVLWTLIFAAAGWLIVVLSTRLAEAINEARQVKRGSIDSQLVKIVFRLVGLFLVVLLVIYAAGFFGIPLTPVLASLGVGGLAIALAVRPTLENIIGGLTLFADKPVRIGEFCRFGNEYGTVEEIGLRSTRLRRLDDTLVTVPNADFSQRELTNYTQRTLRLYNTKLGLRYETTPEQLRYVMTRLQEMLLAHPKVSPDWLHVRFHGFGDYALEVAVFAYIETPDWLEYREIRESINLKILDIVKEAGTGFAFPSQTAYLGRDTGLDPKNAEEAERQVQEWRAKGPLPFREND